METIVRESKPVQLEGVVKSQVTLVIVQDVENFVVQNYIPYLSWRRKDDSRSF